MSLSNVQQLTVETMVEDVPCRFGMYYRRSSGGAAGFPALDLVDIWATTCLAQLLAILSSTVQVMRIMARPLVPTDGVPYEANYDDTTVGTESAEPLPPSIAMLFLLWTNSTNSRNNGHIYLAGLPEDKWVNGVWSGAGFLANVTTFQNTIAVNLPVSMGGAIYTPCIVSRFLNGVKRTPPLTFDVMAIVRRDRISQQRRRQSGQQGIKS